MHDDRQPILLNTLIALAIVCALLVAFGLWERHT